MKKARTKKDNQIAHAKKRAAERYGLVLNRREYMEVVNLIQDGKAQFMYRTSNRLAVFSLTYMETDVVVVYDKQRKTVVTFLPKECLQQEVEA